METTLQNAYREVGQILNLLGNDYKSKIPSNMLAFFEQKVEERNPKELYEEIKNKKISRDALIILSILNTKYWANEDEKQELIAFYNKNEEDYQDKINSYKTQEWLKRGKNKEREQVSLVVIQEKSIWTKIKMFLKSLMSKRK
ncbi:MAG: hypothetical protein HFJ31_02130 [Clostridia bacterium]|nr:hypothetical protein [Clostridia bacterium]